MKLHLVNDQARSTERPKLGLGYISSYLKKYCDDIEISVSFLGDDTLGAIRTIRPDFIGLTATTESFNNVIRMGKEIKEAFNLPVVIGGAHITILPKRLPKWIDAGLIGEGEQTVLEMVESYRNDGVLFNENIKGIIYRDGQRLHQTEMRELINPLDNIPFPDWDMLGLSGKGGT